MRTLLGGWLVLGLVFPLASGARADDAADVKMIVDKAIDAAGGAAKLGKFKAITWKEKGTYYGMGDGLPYTGNYALQWPTHFRMEIEGVFTTVVDGDKGWIKSMGETKELTKEQLSSHKENLAADYATRLLPLRGKQYTLAPLPEIKIDGKPAVGVKASHKGHGDVILYFDKGTSLLAKLEYTAHAEEQKGKEVKQETFFSAYKEVGGIQIPGKIVMKRDGKLYVEAEVLEPKPTDKIDAKVFAKP